MKAPLTEADVSVQIQLLNAMAGQGFSALVIAPTNKDALAAPVAALQTFGDFEEALASANHTRYGLQAGVFTRETSRALRALRELEFGGVIVNDSPAFRVDNMPYGGVKLSGAGREGIRYAMEEMTEPRLIVIDPNH